LYAFPVLINIKFLNIKSYILLLSIFTLLFCLPHKKVTKKVTATKKFAKTTPQKAKILNVANEYFCDVDCF